MAYTLVLFSQIISSWKNNKKRTWWYYRITLENYAKISKTLNTRGW